LTPASLARKFLPLTLLACLLGVLVFATGAGGATYEELPDPMERGHYTVNRVDPLKLGVTTFQEPNSSGGAPTGSNETITAQIRGVMYQPQGYVGKSPLLLFVHGNHGSCDTGTLGGKAPGGPKCVEEGGFFKRNDEGYAYLGENLASWGYTVVSLDQDELMARQDGLGKGMHNRRLLIMAMLDKLKEASEGPVAETADSNVGSLLAGKLDMTRIGLMGHSRGGDAVSSFVEYDHTRPAGERYPLRGVISLAPVDYERHTPYGVPFMTVFGSCDGDVSNLQGARLYERSQYIADPYPTFQVEQIGGNHDAYNTVWQADGDDASGEDAACGPDVTGGKEGTVGGHLTSNTHGIRLSGEAGPHFEVLAGETKPYRIENTNKLDPTKNTRISGDPALMGDQEKLGLATMAAFFRRYVGGEGAFEPYLTGELAAEGKPSIPQSACPTSEAGVRIPCIDRVADSYTAPPDERLDVIRPDTEHPTTLSALGTKISASGFGNPYLKGGGVVPRPATTANGIDWCNPDPKQQEPGQLKETGFPTSAKSCPQPAPTALGGQGKQGGTGVSPREAAPVNGSYGRQLSVAWEEPVENTGSPATLSTMIPAADGDVSGFKALYMAAAVNFFDSRNPARGEEGQWNPETAPQNFTIAVTDAEGDEATVDAGDPRYGTALQQTLGSTSYRVHVILRDLRVPLSDLAAQGVDLSQVRKLELRFGEAGMPQSGSIQLADVRFQQVVGGSDVLLDSTAKNAGPGEGPPTSGPNPVAEMASGLYKRADGSFEIPNVTAEPGASVWTVDDDGAQCPNAQFERIQEAVEYASPWDTIVVCPGVYAESSTPINSALNPVATGATNGLTINKPLKIVGAGASRVTIKPGTSGTLAGTEPFLRDGGGNVVTVSRQSLGSTEYDEEFVDISGVTIESGSTTAEAGVAFFNSSGRISNSVIGPIAKAGTSGWGVIETNSLQGAGSGTAERQVTIANSRIFGYGAGGVLFDGGRGKDAEPTVSTNAGLKQVGYVKSSTIEGSGGTSTIAQDGIVYNAGAGGEVSGSAIAKNQSTTGKSVGILLSKAAGEGTGVKVSGSAISANGAYGLYNGDAALTTPSATAVNASGNYWGTNGTPAEAETVIGPPDVEGISGGGSVTFAPVAGALPIVPAVPALLPDAAPVGEIVNPGAGEAAEAGVAIEPVVYAEDDYGVKSVTLKANGTTVATIAAAPYAFKWTPSPAQIGTSVQLEATITDSSGQVTTDTVTVPVAKSVAETEAQEKAEKEAKEAQEATEKAEAAEKELKEAEEKAEAAEEEAKEAAGEAQLAEEEAAQAAQQSKAAEERAAAANKVAEEKAAAAAQAADAVKEAEAKAAAAAKEAKEANERAEAAKNAIPVSSGKATPNKAKGTARLGVDVPTPGKVVISGPGIKTVSGNATAPGELQILIKAKGRALKTLEKKGEVTVTVTITFTGPSSSSHTTTAVTLIKK
jgi:large repetitive protein